MPPLRQSEIRGMCTCMLLLWGGESVSVWSLHMRAFRYTYISAEICGNDETGADVLYETKVPMPVQKTRHGGRHRDGSGAPCDVGHLYGFGNTLERYLVMVKGCLQRCGPSSGPSMRPSW